MQSPSPATDRPLLITASDEIAEPVLAVCGATGSPPTVVADPVAARSLWPEASMIIIGVDQAAAVSRLVLPRSGRICLVGPPERRDELCDWSGPLDARVVVLPDHAGWLAAEASRSGPGSGGQAVAFVPGCGGAGASTLAAGVAFLAARAGRRPFLIDLDRYGGGLDLIIGAEQLPGWRWPRLARAFGHLEDLSAQVPQLDGVQVLAMSREEPVEPTPEAVEAVLGSARRSHELILVDLGRDLGSAALEATRCVDLTVLVTRDDLRALAATRAVADTLAPTAGDLRLVIRTASRLLDAELISEAIGVEVLQIVPEDGTLAGAAERGDPPGRATRVRWNRACRQLIGQLMPDAASVRLP